VIEFSRNICGLAGANSTEFDPLNPHPVIDLMETQIKVEEKGGTMRLGAYRCQVQPGTHAFKAYKCEEISERHRHRYEVNNRYLERLTSEGLIIAGRNPENGLVEIAELAGHPWFVGVQFHPELKSRVLAAHPLFREFVAAALAYKLNTKSSDPKEILHEDD